MRDGHVVESKMPGYKARRHVDAAAQEPETARSHSESGIMKARWERDDYSHMDSEPLAFAGEDVI
jgi:hypothetical protein